MVFDFTSLAELFTCVLFVLAKSFVGVSARVILVGKPVSMKSMASMMSSTVPDPHPYGHLHCAIQSAHCVSYCTGDFSSLPSFDSSSVAVDERAACQCMDYSLVLQLLFSCRIC